MSQVCITRAYDQVRKEQNEEMDEDQELSAVFNKTLEYTEKFSFYQNRETIKVSTSLSQSLQFMCYLEPYFYFFI